MRRQDQWLLLADRLEYHRSDVVAVCVFLNMKRRPAWIAKALALPLDMVTAIATAAKPLLRQSRREDRGERVCAYCGTDEDLTTDHVMPRSRGGGNETSNKVWACRSCNSAKGARTPEEWLG